jgi:hypothetical protein
MLKRLRGEEDIDTEPNLILQQGIHSEVSQYSSKYGNIIERLYHEKPKITIAAIVRKAGCTRVIAKKWLARVKPVSEE